MLCWSVHLKGGAQEDHAAVAVGHKVYSFGGDHCSDMDQIEVNVFNAVSLSWVKVSPVTTGRGHPPEVPSRRWSHTAVLIEDIIYIWGGLKQTGGYCNVLYAFDVDARRWFKPEVSGTVPEERMYHSACVFGKAMYIYGGRNQLTRYTQGMYRFDTITVAWSLINTRGTLPRGSECHSATIIGTKMFVFGGGGLHQDNFGGLQKDGISVFDTETNCWLSMPSEQLPEERCFHSAFAYNDELYIFGGENFNQPFNDMWKFSPKTFSWKKVEPKWEGPSEMSFMCCCMVEDRIILFGGYKRSTPTDDLYILDLNPSLKTFCKLAVIQHSLEQSGLPQDIRWELTIMSPIRNRKKKTTKSKKWAGLGSIGSIIKTWRMPRLR